MKTSNEILINLVAQLQKENEELRNELNMLKGYTQIIPNPVSPSPSYSNRCSHCGMTIYGNHQYHNCYITWNPTNSNNNV